MQLTFGEAEGQRKRTRRGIFLADIDQVVPWKALLKLIEPHYPKMGRQVEHPFRVIKRQFGHTKVRYRGLAKNTTQVLTLFALSDMWMARRRLASAAG